MPRADLLLIPRRQCYSSEHGNPDEKDVWSHKHCCGRVYSIYAFKNRKWVKIGELCSTCGLVKIREDFKEILK